MSEAPKSSHNRPRSFEEVIQADGRYPLEAYAFLQDCLGRAVKDAYGSEGGKARTGGHRHVTGQQICLALRELAIERWGMLARTVLDKWGVRETMDFGNMVYLLIDNNLMKKTEEDSIEDFRDIFDFAEAFGGNGGFELKDE